MSQPPAPLMIEKTFQSVTEGKFPFRGRSNLRGIDDALHLYWASAPTTKRSAVLNVCTRCAQYLDKPSKDQERAFQERVGKVEDLLKQAFRLLQYFDREAKKSSSQNHGAGKSLSRGYHLERETYLKSNKAYAVSGTTSRDGWEIDDDQNRKSFDSISCDEFKQYAVLVNLADKDSFLDVKYVRGQERLKYLATIRNGLFYYESFRTPLNMKGQALYAIDIKGNIYIYAHHEFESEKLMTNHSSALAGKDALCAGMIDIKGGQLAFISNESGHYAPTLENLANAVRLLQGEGVAMNSTVVTGRYLNSQREDALKTWNGAGSFLRDYKNLA